MAQINGSQADAIGEEIPEEKPDSAAEAHAGPPSDDRVWAALTRALAVLVGMAPCKRRAGPWQGTDCVEAGSWLVVCGSWFLVGRFGFGLVPVRSSAAGEGDGDTGHGRRPSEPQTSNQEPPHRSLDNICYNDYC